LNKLQYFAIINAADTLFQLDPHEAAVAIAEEKHVLLHIYTEVKI
jgi:hypothetical protein